MEIIEKVVFDFNNELWLLEKIILKYVKLPDNLLFIKNNRYPVYDKSKIGDLSKLNIVSNKPFCPFLCVNMVEDLILNRMYIESCHFDLFKKNPSLESNSTNFIGYLDKEPEDIVAMHIKEASDVLEDIITYTNKHIDRVDIDAILKIVERMINIVEKYTYKFKDHVYAFNFDSSNVVMQIHGHIKTIRFDELMDHIETRRLIDEE